MKEALGGIDYEIPGAVPEKDPDVTLEGISLEESLNESRQESRIETLQESLKESSEKSIKNSV